MLEAIRTVSEAVKAWREDRETLSQLVAGLSAALVVVSASTGALPSDSLAAVARAVGAMPVADWFGAHAPSLLTADAPFVQPAALSAAAALLVVMVAVPLWRGRHDDGRMFGYEPLRLLGAPSTATVWLLLLVAAQYGDIAPVLRQWARTASSVGVWTMIALGVAGALFLAGSRFGFGDLVRLLLRPPALLAYRIGFGACAALFAVALAAVSLPLSLIGRMSGLESTHSRSARHEIEKERAERAVLPTGAAGARIRAA